MHPNVRALLKFFDYQHLPPELQQVRKPCRELAHQMAQMGLDGPELTVGLRKLLEATDAFMRAQSIKPAAEA